MEGGSSDVCILFAQMRPAPYKRVRGAIVCPPTLSHFDISRWPNSPSTIQYGSPLGGTSGFKCRQTTEVKKWIFVSHASSDIKHVRKVRNYLERKGASPLLFHLLSLSHPEAFWPIIRDEISARNFFLYCDSEKARDREWVLRERAEVAKIAKSRPIRIGQIRVDTPKLDRSGLNRFLSDLRVFLSYSRHDADRVMPFVSALDSAGFQISRGDGLSFGDEWMEAVSSKILQFAQDGWVLVFITSRTQSSSWVAVEFRSALKAQAKIVPVLFEKIEVPYQYSHLQIFDATVCTRTVIT